MYKNNIYLDNIKEQQSLLYNCIGLFLKKGLKVALLDFPNHNNVGDNAIWLGEKEALKKLGVEVVYQCDIYTYSEKALRKQLNKGGIVLLHGGGNLGSVWPEHQMFREKIIKTLPDMNIIQLPQSVYFDNENGKQQFGEIARAHPTLNILVRDKVSFDILNDLNLKVKLCPDMAFALGPLASSGKSKVDAVWLARTDHESAGYSLARSNFKIEKLDWLMGEPGRYYSKFSPKVTVRIRRLVQKIFRNSSFTRNNLWKINAKAFDLLAQRRLNRGIRILSRGKMVITDRLHGHIISTLLGKPQILFDNHYKKIGNYRECFEHNHEAIFYDLDIKDDLEKEISNLLTNSDRINHD
ncbi:polysaccharide pyruvyl transferase family protein [Marivirga arenosa]|uniref:Polysaccharide pyruvyl transferase family protein n=1 Tax=Marivirga arenosa TaxID=3059076 RepID=A0AA51X4U1_9BACT|nr:polysaccharide pyruvyl transferase family protein [Marivirga sp. BKB1-2]WNB16863.1 polysaccharide pyruvyl transferase family protein [Marivirga sp. BKB1-2]